MSVGKRIAIIFSLLAVVVIGVLGYIYYPAIQGMITGNKYYTQEDVQNSYDDGYNDGFETETEMKEKLSYYMTMVDEYQLNIETLNLEVERINKQNLNYQAEIKSLEDTKAKNISTIAELTDSNKAKDGTIATLTEDITELESNVLSLESQVDTLESDVASKTTQISMLNSQINSLENEIATLEASGENKDSEINELKTQKAVLETEKANLQASIESKNAEITSLNQTIENKNAEISTLNTRISVLETEISTNEKTIAELEQTNTSLNNQITALNTDLANAQNQISELNTKVSNLEKSVADYESYIAELEGANLAIAIFEYDNSLYEIKEVDDSGYVSIEDPVSTEYMIFNYWTLNGEQVNLSEYQITKNTKFVADITYKYKVDFVVDNEVISSQIITKGENVSLPESPAKDKYTFAGWSVDGYNVIDLSNYVITANTTFTAIFNNKYGVFNSDTGTLFYSWDDLLKYDYLVFDEETKTLRSGANVNRLAGDLYVDEAVEIIDESCFQNCSALVSVYMTDNVKELKTQAFANCKSLINIRMSESLHSIEQSAFNGCSNLVSVSIPDSVTSMGWLVFANCSKLESVKLSENMEEVSIQCFYNCTSLVNVRIPDACKYLRNYCFYKTGLTSIDTNNVIDMNHPFVACPNLTTITFSDKIEVVEHMFSTIPNLQYNYYEGLKYLGNENNPYLVMCEIEDKTLSEVYFAPNVRVLCQTFADNTGLTSVTVPDTVVGICYEAFHNTKLQSVEMANYVKFIGDSAFYENRSLTSLKLSNNLISIGTSAFSYCTVLTEITLPATLQSIGGRAFSSCWRLATVRFSGTPHLTSIGYFAFLSCSDLTSIYIPSSVEKLGYDNATVKTDHVFRSCSSSLVIYVELETPRDNWGECWNYYDNEDGCGLTVKYGYTYSEYLAEVGSTT